jgi:hypothetical protein
MSSPIQNHLDRCRALIRQHGYMVQSFLGDESTPSWSYTVGLTRLLGFDLVVFGLPADVATLMLNRLVSRLKAVPIQDLEPISELANFPLRLISHDGQVTLGVADALGLTPTRLRILQWPDTQGRYPGEAGYACPLFQSFDDINAPPARN